MKKSNDTIGNRTRDLPACSAVSQPTAPPRAPLYTTIGTYYSSNPTRRTYSHLKRIASISRCIHKVVPPDDETRYARNMYKLTACQQAVSINLYDIYLLLCIQYQALDDGQKTCPKHVEFYSKNKFEKLVHLAGFIIRIYHDARSSECQNERIALTVNSHV